MTKFVSKICYDNAIDIHEDDYLHCARSRTCVRGFASLSFSTFRLSDFQTFRQFLNQ